MNPTKDSKRIIRYMHQISAWHLPINLLLLLHTDWLEIEMKAKAKKIEYPLIDRIYDIMKVEAVKMQLYGRTKKIQKEGDRLEKIADKAIKMLKTGTDEKTVLKFLDKQIGWHLPINLLLLLHID